MVNKMNGESVDLTAQNIAQLKQLFPEILTDGDKIDFDMLKTVLGEVVETEQERYQFTWHGKKKMIEGAQKPSKGTLRPVPEKSKNFDTTENLYIEGDNLEVLKLLQKSYNGKIKMIYIDPPYNTGKDFVYKDNFKDGVQNYLEQTGQVDAEGNVLSTNTERNGRFHTDWLNMMYARLKLARNLLTDDGVIFVSIDDSESNNIGSLCNEVFGENNFISKLIWKKRRGGGNDSRFIAVDHEYVYVYAKNLTLQPKWRVKYQDEYLKRYKEKDEVNRYYWDTLSRPGLQNPIVFDYVCPDGQILKIYSQKSEKSFREGLESGSIRVVKLNNEWTAHHKVYMPEGRVLRSLIEEGGTNNDAGNELNELFGFKPFDYPKPTKLLKNLIDLICKGNDIILDFFSGSATTAHATMQLNSEDGGNRKFIMVQLPEPLDEKSEAYKDGYRTICDIGEERIRRAGEKIKAELKEKQQKAGMLGEDVVDPDSLDIGFKVLKLDTSNIREWNVDFSNLEDELDLYETPFIDGRSELDIVYEIILKQGLQLTYPIETFEVNGKTIYDIAFGSLFICLANGITTDIAKAIIARRDEHDTETSSVIFSDTGFKNDSEKLNCIEVLKDAGYPEDNLLTL